MRILPITGFYNINNINFKSKQHFDYTKPNISPKTNEVFDSGLGRDIVHHSLGDAIFDYTIKKNYFQLPQGCSPDQFQIEAGKALLADKDVLVEAPTGTGKTAIAHYAATKNMANGKTTFYTTPLKALSNQKLREFRAVYGDENVGILTGDRRENVEAPIIIMTTEVYRNMALANKYEDENPLMQNLGTVIFDEFHYLGDPDRGPVWEESVMYTPEGVQTLALSATIGNPQELSDWMGKLKNGNVALISIPSEARHVPLSFDMINTQSYNKGEKYIQKKLERGETPDYELSDDYRPRKPKPTDYKQVVEQLNSEEKLPAILFIFSKKQSREVLEYFAKQELDLTTADEKEQIQKILDKYEARTYIGADLNVDALKKGYAIHNAGIIPGQKELIEELFQKKLIKVVLSTETLAAGINMPAKTVVISSPYKPCDDDTQLGRLVTEEQQIFIEEDEDEEGEKERTPVRLLTSNEFKQMAGRAGRRGIDPIGYVYTMPTDKHTEEEFLFLEVANCNNLNSNYNPDYGFLSGYFEHNSDIEELENIFNNSFFAHSIDEEEGLSKVDELIEVSDRKTQVLLDRGFVSDEDGLIIPQIGANMAAKVKGYDALNLTETILSGVLEGISPQALALIAGSIAIPSNSKETTIGFDTSFIPVYKCTEQSVKELHQRLVDSVNSMLGKFGKSVGEFSSFEQMLEFANSIKKPDASALDIKQILESLRTKRDKVYKITKTTGNYFADELVSAIKAGEIIPTRILQIHLDAVERYKKKLKSVSIDERIAQLQVELNEMQEEAALKGAKAKARIERKCKDIEAELEFAKNMKYLDEHISDLLIANDKYLKQNPPESIVQEFNKIEKFYNRLTLKDDLLLRIEALKTMEEEYGADEQLRQTFRYGVDKRNVDMTIKKMLENAQEICISEAKYAISTAMPKYNINSAQILYIWSTLNQVNPVDTMTNWKQLIKIVPPEVADEGTIYRTIMQSADLLSQIAEMATVGMQKSENIDYYKELKQTAQKARELLIKEPIVV